MRVGDTAVIRSAGWSRTEDGRTEEFVNITTEMSQRKASIEPPRRWLFLTSHAHVLLQIARAPDSSASVIAEAVGITLRQTQRVVADLLADGYLEIERRGTTNQYRVHPEVRLRHPNLADIGVGVILAALTDLEAAPDSGSGCDHSSRRT